MIVTHQRRLKDADARTAHQVARDLDLSFGEFRILAMDCGIGKLRPNDWVQPSHIAKVKGALESVHTNMVCSHYGVCPVCGDPIDYCPGHGEIGDPEGYSIMQEIEEIDG